jgi:hypothetical protein
MDLFIAMHTKSEQAKVNKGNIWKYKQKYVKENHLGTAC